MIIQQIILTIVIKIIEGTEKMCSKCCQGQDSRPRVRCTPTFFHHPIFDDYSHGCQQQPRCTGTYYSTVFDQNPPNKCNCNNSKNPRRTGSGSPSSYNCCQQPARTVQLRNCAQDDARETDKIVRPSSAHKETRLQKQISFNPHASTKFEKAGGPSQLSNHTMLWYDPEKQVLLRNSFNCHHHGFSKERKLLELSSCPFYQPDSAQRIEGAYCRSCRKLTDCPLCGGSISCQRCRYENGCNCSLTRTQNQVCTCGPCKKCGCGTGFVDNRQQSKPICKCINGQCKCGRNCQCGQQCPCCPKHEANRLSSCNKCAQYCPCDKKCLCGDNCSCCEKKIWKKTVKKQENECGCRDECCPCGPSCVCGPNCWCCSKNKGCDCSKGNCNCKYNCTCGSKCKCCPKFMPYGTCLCDKGCRCGPSCECECECCPKNKKVVCPKQSYKKNQVEAKFCQCGPQCGCGPECRCGPQCKCGQMKAKFNDKKYQLDPKGTKTTAVAGSNGTKKAKNQQGSIRKSEPVFKSVTANRR